MRRQVISWRYILLPLLVMIQQLAFYVYVFITTPPPNEVTTTWSSIIRLESGVAFLVVILLYWKAHKING
jgi:hypothetical protein